MILTEWNPDLINSLVNLAEEFIAETAFPVTFDMKKAIERLSFAFDDPNGDVILAVDPDTGDVMGAAVVYAMADWQKENFGYVEKFFVSSKYRGSGVGREIANTMANWFDAHDCIVSFVTSTANIGQGGQFRNLMAKFGYADIGPTLARKINHGKNETEIT